MNRNRRQRDEHESLPADIGSLGAMLDRAADLDGGCAGLEDRVIHASLANLKGLSTVQSRAAALGAADRAAASAGLELRVSDSSSVHLVTAGLLAEESTLVHAGGRPRVAAQARRRSWAISGRVRAFAAVLFVGVGGVIAWQMTQPVTPAVWQMKDAVRPSTADLRAGLDDSLDTLLSAVADSRKHASKDADTTQSGGSIDDIWDEGSSG